MNGDVVLQTAQTLNVSATQVFVRCARAHHLKSAEKVAEDRHMEWQRNGTVPDYVKRWCLLQVLSAQQQSAEGHPLFI